MLVNIIRKIKISNRMNINTAIITINTIKTITMPIFSYLIFKKLFCSTFLLTKKR